MEKIKLISISMLVIIGTVLSGCAIANILADNEPWITLEIRFDQTQDMDKQVQQIYSLLGSLPPEAGFEYNSSKKMLNPIGTHNLNTGEEYWSMSLAIRQPYVDQAVNLLEENGYMVIVHSGEKNR